MAIISKKSLKLFFLSVCLINSKKICVWKAPFCFKLLIQPSSFQFMMIHKIRYFESKQLSEGIYLQDVVNEFLSQKGENIIAVLPVMDSALLVHYKE